MNDDHRDELAAFLEEDLGRGDITSESLIPEATEAAGEVRSGEAAVLAGLEEATLLAETMQLETTAHAKDGEEIDAARRVLEVDGKARAILGVERTLLNLLSHMSGVATLTHRAVHEVVRAHTGAHADRPPRISATRKTLPGLRRLQKKAVVLGGGVPHRSDLSDAVLVKDNHLSLNPDLAGLMRQARQQVGAMPIEIEVESMKDALLAAEAGADSLLLDNLSPAAVTEIVEALCSAGLRNEVSLEASGGISVGTVHEYADTGVDVISMGMLTTSAHHIDFSLHFKS
jgi:nicotinate-nucleotide pyrophosphorylase (carboxylating)